MPSAGPNPNPASRPFRRELGLDLVKSHLEDLPDGGLIIHGQKMLAEGTWTDSGVGTPLFYPSRSLEQYATNWKDNSGWSRHLGGVPRDITEKVGMVENLHYSDRAVVGDVRLHGATQRSKDTIALVKAGLANYISVEHGGSETYNPKARQYEADELSFYGFAIVNRGACTLCSIPRTNEAPEGEETTMDQKELEATITELQKELEAVKVQKTEVKVEVPKELSEKIEALGKTNEALEKANKELADRLKKIEEAPAPAATAPGSAPERELGDVETIVVIDAENKTVRGV